MTITCDRDQTVTALENAAARLRDKGWTKGQYGPTGGPNCLVGAVMYEVRHARLGLRPALNAVRAAITETGVNLGERYGPEYWNDAYCPSAEAAIDMLGKAAKWLAAQQGERVDSHGG